MTKKDFELIAATLQEVRQDLPPELRDPDATFADIVWAFTSALDASNPRFDRFRFARACVPGSNVKARGAK